MSIHLKIATLNDWGKLYEFYCKIYRLRHPLQNLDFFKWQYDNPENGRAFIVCDEEKIYGHMGIYFVDGFSWMLNLYLDPVLRGKGWLNKLYNKAKEFNFILAATGASEAGLEFFKKMGWVRYSNLERLININPAFNKVKIHELIRECRVLDNHTAFFNEQLYWKQPGITGLQLSDGSTGVSQHNQGGFRFVDIVNNIQAEKEVWQLGYLWCDYITSWNNKQIAKLIASGWIPQNKISFPWFLSPVDYTKKFEVNFLSEEYFDKNFIIKRYHSDHGRVGSL